MNNKIIYEINTITNIGELPKEVVLKRFNEKLAKVIVLAENKK